MIMAVTPEQRKAALDLLLPYQRSDFEGIFRAMDGIFLLFHLLIKYLSDFKTTNFGDIGALLGTKVFLILNAYKILSFPSKFTCFS